MKICILFRNPKLRSVVVRSGKISGLARYQHGDYVKVEFPDETTGIGEWMWVRVDRCDERKQLVFGTLDNEPLNDYSGKVKLGSELAISYSRIKEHRKAV